MRFSKLIVLTGGLLLLRSHCAIAQVPDYHNFEQRKNAAVSELKKFPVQDTSRVNALVNIFSQAMFLKQRQAVMPYCDEAFVISRRLHYAKGLAHCYVSRALYYKSMLDRTKAQLYLDSVIFLSADTQDKQLLALRAQALESKGMIFREQENYYPALNCFFEALKYAAYMKPFRVIVDNTFIAEIYIGLENLEKAEEYALKAIGLAEKDGDKITAATIYLPYIDICIAKNNLQRAVEYLDKINPVIPDPDELQINFGYYEKRGRINFLQKKYSTAMMYYQLAHKYAMMGGHKNSVSNALGFLSVTALKMGNNEAARNYALQNLSAAEESNIKEEKMDALMHLSDYYQQTGQSAKAYGLLQQAVQLKDSLMAETNLKQVNILGAMYENDRKEKEIIQLQNEQVKQALTVRQKSTLNIVFVAAIAAILIFMYLAYRNIKSSQQISKQLQAIQLQQITELEKDKQLLAIDAMLKGQEEERNRIAKDLHDGLGGLLSGTKLSFVSIKEKLQMSPVDVLLFDKSLHMLDNTISDLRKVAQNLMPEALVKFGLHEALRDFCDTIHSSAGIKIVYQQFGEKRPLNHTAEVFIYRIVQELVNNAVKHAGASQIMVQLAMEKTKVGITVEDDGAGFDKSMLAAAKGAGLANINYRVRYFNGSFDMVTSPGKGCSVNIELIA